MSDGNPLTRILPTLAAVAFIALFTALGFWQLGRADFKRDLWRDFQSAGQAQAARVTGIAELAAMERYRPVELSGRYKHTRQILLDNRVHDGTVGVHVFTPLELDDGAVLVNRGWLPMDRGRREAPEAPAPANAVTVRGLVTQPPATGLELGEIRAPEEWPWLTPYLRLDTAREALDMRLADRVVLLAPDEPHGYLRDWEPATLPEQQHTAYAVQWFALALTVAVIWVLLTMRAGRPRARDAERDE